MICALSKGLLYVESIMSTGNSYEYTKCKLWLYKCSVIYWFIVNNNTNNVCNYLLNYVFLYQFIVRKNSDHYKIFILMNETTNYKCNKQQMEWIILLNI